MSIPVDLGALREELATHERPAYLITAGPEGPPHTAAVFLRWVDGVIEAGCGNSTARNLTTRDAVTLTVPPNDVDGYTLIIDATGVVVEGDERIVRMTPSHAVLHRPGTSGTSGCGHDCAPVG